MTEQQLKQAEDLSTLYDKARAMIQGSSHPLVVVHEDETALGLLLAYQKIPRIAIGAEDFTLMTEEHFEEIQETYGAKYMYHFVLLRYALQADYGGLARHWISEAQSRLHSVLSARQMYELSDHKQAESREQAMKKLFSVSGD